MVGHSSERIVIEDNAADAAILGERAGLGLDLLRGKNSLDRREQGVTVHQLEVTGELLNTVDIAPALELDRDVRTRFVPCQNIDRADGRVILSSHELVSIAEGVDVLGEQLLKIRLDTVLDETRIDTKVVTAIAENLVDAYHEHVGCFVMHDLPDLGDPGIRLVLLDLDIAYAAGRTHPVERLIRAAVRVNQDAAVALNH